MMSATMRAAWTRYKTSIGHGFAKGLLNADRGICWLAPFKPRRNAQSAIEPNDRQFDREFFRILARESSARRRLRDVEIQFTGSGTPTHYTTDPRQDNRYGSVTFAGARKVYRICAVCFGLCRVQTAEYRNADSLEPLARFSLGWHLPAGSQGAWRILPKDSSP